MKISLKWLADYVAVDWEVSELVHRLTMAGLEEESVEDRGAALADIVVGKVLEREPHPNADRLSVCRVDVGAAEPRTIVCGAPNVAAGQTVPVVLPGSQLPDGTRIGKAKLRGVASEGMICSEVELGIGEDSSGILVLPDEWSAGAAFAPAAGLDDVIVDFEVTPNRPDCLSVVGIAREVAALAGVELSLPFAEPPEAGGPVAEATRVDVEDPEGCPRYVARVLKGLRVGPSPAWLQQRLRAIGQRPINNVVDVTNFVMLELGQPLHAFDLNRLEEGRIVVRRARPGERLRTLDDVERALDAETLVIADAHRPVALAGIMGGADSEVTDATTDVLIESAYFDPRRIRHAARRLGLHTEASTRFERGADWDLPARAADRAAALLLEVAGGELAAGALDVAPALPVRRSLTLRPERAAELLALPLDAAACARILRRLGCEVSGTGPLDVVAPSFRPDLEREIDLVEEVGRIHGYGEVPVDDSVRGPLPQPGAGGYDAQRRLRAALLGLGLDEAVTSSIVADDWTTGPWAAAGEPGALQLANPPAEGISRLRTSLLPGLLDVARRNRRQRARGVALFEVGRVFGGASADGEEVRVAGLLCGEYGASPWRADRRDADLLDLKGVVEALLTGIEAVSFEPADLPWCRRGHAARVLCGDDTLGWLGQLDGRAGAAFDLPDGACIFELHCTSLFAAWAGRSIAYRSLSRFPPIERDLAIVLDEQVPAARVAEQIRAAAPELVADVTLFDVYAGDQVGAGQRSLAFTVRLRSAERTLEDADADAAIDAALKGLEQAFGARQR